MNTLKNLYNKSNEFVGKVIHGRQTLSPKVEALLKQVGNATIISADIGRTAVPGLITGLIKILSSTPYEKLWHLFIVLHTTQGDILFEKNEVINMTKSGMPKGAEVMHVPHVPEGLTIQQLVDNTARFLGTDFIPYRAKNANCQNFQIGILKSNNMDTPELTKFIKQDTEDIFKNPHFRKFAHTITDIAGRADVIFQGGSLDKDFRFQNNELDNFQLDTLMRRFKIPYNGIYIADEMPNRLSNGNYIINLNGQSHWVGLIKNGPNVFYFDSYGFGAPTSVESLIPKNYTWESEDIQHINSSSCGWFVVCWLRFMKLNGPSKESYKSFIKLFSKRNLDENESILGGLLC